MKSFLLLRKQQAYGTACRQPDGSWHLQPAPSQVASASPPPPPNVAYPPPQVVNAYPPAYFPPGYYYPRPYYSTVFIGGFVGGRHFEREHGRR